MSKEKEIKVIREVCIKANSEIAELKEIENPRPQSTNTHFIEHRPIRLADVLLAIDRGVKIGDSRDVKEDGGMSYLGLVSFIYDKWNLKDDNLEN